MFDGPVTTKEETTYFDMELERVGPAMSKFELESFWRGELENV